MSRTDNAALLGLYRLMAQSRALDRTLGAHDGHWHGLEGEEAIIAGIYYGLRPTDWVAPHYRGSVTAALAKGADLRRIMAGCLGRVTAYHGGRHRSDVCGPPDLGLIGIYAGSLGPPIGYAAGGALAAKLDGRDDVGVAVFGDGSSARGDCHEAMNMAAVLNLPMIFVCQNNQFAISTPASTHVAGSVAGRGASFGIPSVEVDGNDVLAVYDAMQAALHRARSGRGPSVIDARSYRVAGHFYSDREDYRDPAEVALWRAKDPVARIRHWLLEQGVADMATLDALDAETAVEVETGFAAALADPPPGDLAARSVYAGERA
ncbi:MAG: thiamine pyrophosphate-dependent dehydrogenase E1 component subunit alpha [Pararhodobacter sp.]